MKWGLVDGKSGSTINIESITVDIEIIDILARVKVTKEYINSKNEDSELIFTYPLENNCSIYSFTATIDGEVIEAKIHESQRAKDLFEKAINNDKSAILLQKNENDFTISLGNCPLNTMILIDFEYVVELQKTINNEIIFNLPSCKIII
jgi:hypothetical protein